MGTKNFFSIAALIICGLVCVNSVKAEGTPSKTDNVTLNIKFKPVQSITVNPAQKTVDLKYYTLENYRDGVSTKMDDHLTVFSTGGFVVSVSTTTDKFVRSAGGEIPVSDITVTAENGTTTNSTFTPEEVSLSIAPKALITTNAGGNELKYNITYNNTVAGKDYNYINNYIHPDAESVYTATVTYTIATN